MHIQVSATFKALLLALVSVDEYLSGLQAFRVSSLGFGWKVSYSTYRAFHHQAT